MSNASLLDWPPGETLQSPQITHGFSSVAVRGGSAAVRGGSAAVRGGSAAVRGGSAAVRGGSVAERGIAGPQALAWIRRSLHRPMLLLSVIHRPSRAGASFSARLPPCARVVFAVHWIGRHQKPESSAVSSPAT